MRADLRSRALRIPSAAPNGCFQDLDELVGRRAVDERPAREPSDPESAQGRIEGERNTVHDEPAADRDLDRSLSVAEGPPAARREWSEDDTIVSSELARCPRRSARPQIRATREAAHLTAPQLVRHDGGVFQYPRTKPKSKGSLKSRVIEWLIGRLFPSPDAYAEAMLPLLVSPDIEGRSGAMFDQKGEAILPSRKLQDASHVEAFLGASESLLRHLDIHFL